MFPIIKSDLTQNVFTSSLATLVLVPKITFTQNTLRHLPQYHIKDQKSCLISAGLPPKGTPMQVCYPSSVTDFNSVLRVALILLHHFPFITDVLCGGRD